MSGSSNFFQSISILSCFCICLKPPISMLMVDLDRCTKNVMNLLSLVGL